MRVSSHFHSGCRHSVFFFSIITAGAALCLSAPAMPAEEAANAEPLPQAAVTALNRVAGGAHPGFRANHAKGVLLTGRFTASKEASGLSKAAHLKHGADVPILVRFSNGTGVPDLPDADPNASPHGMAIRFTLPDSSSTDIVAISANSFPVATPEEFVELLNAIADSRTSSAKPPPIQAFLAKHPKADAWAHTPRPQPASFGTLAFYGVNAFKFTNAAGAARYGRYQIVPGAGEHALPESELKTAKPDYLMEEVRQRVVKSPVTYQLRVQLAEPGDVLDDGSVAWPSSRKTLTLGTLTLDGVAKDQVGEQRGIMFTPLALVDGIEPSTDPILLFRPLAYAISFLQRAQ